MNALRRSIWFWMGFAVICGQFVFAKDNDADAAKLFSSDGGINKDVYTRLARAWDVESVERRLGPAFTELNPNAPETRPENFKQPSKNCSVSFANRSNPYELSSEKACEIDDDYWSDSGQIAYVPDDAEKDPGLDRFQAFAYYNHVFALSPRLDLASGTPHPDPQTQESNYRDTSGQLPRQPVAMVRNYGMLQNEALVVYRDGLLAVAGTQTSRSDTERPYPGIFFPKNKVPTGIAVTTENEFAVVTIWDTDTCRGQLAVVALEGKYIPFHTWSYIGLPNQGSFSDLKLLGYIDLPFATPSAVAAASNGWWNGPSQTAGQTFGQIDLTNDGVRNLVYRGDWTGIIANKGYVIVASRLENKIAWVDLSPLLNFVGENYFGSETNFRATQSNRGPGPKEWPQTFSEKNESMPKVVGVETVEKPTAVLAGLRIDRWTNDRFKSHVACEDGTIRIYDTSSLMARFPWEKNEPLKLMGTFKVGRNPAGMCFTRFGDCPSSLLPKTPQGQPSHADPLNNSFYVACRGDREVLAVVTWEGKGAIYRRIQDVRMDDPVAVSVAMRGYIVSVADFRGRKLHSFRIGPITDRYGHYYGVGADGKADFEYAGSLPLAGRPFLVNSANVN